MSKVLPPLRILNRPVSAELVDQEALPGKWGDCQAMASRIRVCEDMDSSGEAHVLVHEIMHVYDDVLGVALHHRQIDSMAYAFVDLVQNNPELIKYLVKAKR